MMGEEQSTGQGIGSSPSAVLGPPKGRPIG